jgi:hypothetical protein
LKRWVITAAMVLGLLGIYMAPAHADDPTATIEVAPTATLNSAGVLTVTVVVTCVPLDEYKFGPPLAEVVVVQERGHTLVRGSGGAVVTCDNTPHTYEMLVDPDEGSAPFRPGRATVTPIIGICGFLNSELVCERADNTPQTLIVRPAGTGSV